MTQPILNVIAGLYEPFAYEDLAVGATATKLTRGKYRPTDTGSLSEAQRAIMTLETAQIRYTYNGTTPTASLGHLANDGDVIVLIGLTALDNFQAFATGASGDLRITYER